MNDDLDLQQLMDMLDIAMTSDDPRIKDTFRRLMMIVALTDTDKESQIKGPLRRMNEELLSLHSKIASLQTEIQMIRQTMSSPYNPNRPYTGTGTGAPWWGSGTGPGGNITCSTSVSSDTFPTVTITKV